MEPSRRGAAPQQPPIAQLRMDTDGLGPSRSLVLTNLHHVNSALTVPYWKRLIKLESDTAHGSQLKRDAMALGRDFQNLVKLHERQETTALDLRHKLKLLRQEGAAKEKQLELAHRTIERLAVGNSGLEAGAASDKAYIRRLEAQVLAARGASELESRCAQLHAEAESLRCQLLAADQRATAAEEQAREKTSDVEFLRRGVELAAEQLTRSAGANVSATMLLSVVRGQEEAVDLSQQLAAAQEQVAQLTAALEAAHGHLKAQHEALTQWKEFEERQTAEADEAAAALEAARAACEQLRGQVEALSGEAAAAEADCRASRQRLEAEITSREDAEQQAQALQQLLIQQQDANRAMRGEVQRLTALENARPAPAPVDLFRPSSTSPRPAPGLSAQRPASQQRRESTRRQPGQWSPPPAPAAPAPRSGLRAGRPAAATPPPAQLDGHIAALERELAQLEAARSASRGGASRAPAAAPPPRAQWSPRRLPQRSPSPALPSAQPPAAHSMWRSNPLASPEKPSSPAENAAAAAAPLPTQRSLKRSLPAAAAAAAAFGGGSLAGGQALSEESEWRLLERGLLEQQSADRQLMALWQAQRGSEAEGDGASALSLAPGHGHTAASSPASSSYANAAAPAPQRPALCVSVPSGEEYHHDAVGSSSAPGAPGGQPLPSPQLESGSRDGWLDEAAEMMIEQLEVKSAVKAPAAARAGGKRGGGGGVISLTAVAAGSRGAAAAAPRQTLFDLAGMSASFS